MKAGYVPANRCAIGALLMALTGLLIRAYRYQNESSPVELSLRMATTSSACFLLVTLQASSRPCPERCQTCQRRWPPFTAIDTSKDTKKGPALLQGPDITLMIKRCQHSKQNKLQNHPKASRCAPLVAWKLVQGLNQSCHCTTASQPSP